MPLLEVKDLAVRYDKAVILSGVSLRVEEGELVGLVGPNGAGKSTLLRAISGLVRFEERMKRGVDGEIALLGEVRFAGERIDGVPAHEIRERGLVLCPERRRPFRELTVEENLLAGAYLSRGPKQRRQGLERAYALFPALAGRKAQVAGKLSGGEQQMLAIARALMYQAKLLAIDEPSLGLAPRLREEVFAAIGKIHAEGTPVLLVEQNVRMALAVTDRVLVLGKGALVFEGATAEFQRREDELKGRYLGV